MAHGINVVAVCPNLRVRNTLIRAIQRTGNIVPTGKRNTDSAQRALYPPAESRLIINVTSTAVHELLGGISAALAIEVGNQAEAAQQVKQIFNEAGFEATIHTRALPEFPDGFLTFVTVPALKGIALLFWPRSENITPELAAQLPAQEPWSPEDLEV